MAMCCDKRPCCSYLFFSFLSAQAESLDMSGQLACAASPHIGSWHNPSTKEHAGWRSLQLMAYFAVLCFLERFQFDSDCVSEGLRRTQ
jgi:hypothetical protein